MIGGLDWMDRARLTESLPSLSPHAGTWGMMTQIVAVIVFVMVGMMEAAPAALRGLTWAAAGFVVAHLGANYAS